MRGGGGPGLGFHPGQHFTPASRIGEKTLNRIREPATVELLLEESLCAACPLRDRCTTSERGRSVTIHPDERLLVELRERQATPDGRAKLRERVAVEHTLAHIGRWQGRRARYRQSSVFDSYLDRQRGQGACSRCRFGIDACGGDRLGL